MKRPRSDVVMRRFMAGEDVDCIAATPKVPTKSGEFTIWKAWTTPYRVEAALRRAMLASEKRRKRCR